MQMADEDACFVLCAFFVIFRIRIIIRSTVRSTHTHKLEEDLPHHILDNQSESDSHSTSESVNLHDARYKVQVHNTD